MAEWAPFPPLQGDGGDGGGAEYVFPEADEAVTGAGVTLRLPAEALDDLPSLAAVLSMHTCAAPACTGYRKRSRWLTPHGPCLCSAGGGRR